MAVETPEEEERSLDPAHDGDSETVSSFSLDDDEKEDDWEDDTPL